MVSGWIWVWDGDISRLCDVSVNRVLYQWIMCYREHMRNYGNGSSIVSETDSCTSFVSTRTDTSCIDPPHTNGK